jgi:energy-coupling factor transporter ATP-binding protein EcfA2
MHDGLEGFELLDRLQAHAALDPVLLREDLAEVHVPFETMTGTPLETPATAALGHTERLAVVGPSGSGKSSFIARIVSSGPSAGGVRFAPIRIPVEGEPSDVVTDPAEFGRHVIRTVVRQAVQAGTMSRRAAAAAQRSAAPQSVTRGRGGSLALGAPAWMIDANVSAELSSLFTSVDAPTTADVMTLGEQLVVTLAEHGLYPVIVIDDSDAWLKTVGRSDLVVPFFRRIIPMLAKEWSTGLVVAVHDEYLQSGAYPSGQGWLNHEVRMPALPDVEAMALVLQVRIQHTAGRDCSAADVFSPEALEELFTQHRQPGHNIRKSLLDAHTALKVAVDAGASRISPEHVRSAFVRLM